MPEPDERAVIAALWAHARPRLLARVEALEAAVAAELREPEREHALAQAHTLVGTLGTFGRPAASDAARAAEAALEVCDGEAVNAAVVTLRAEIQTD